MMMMLTQAIFFRFNHSEGTSLTLDAFMNQLFRMPQGDLTLLFSR